MENHLPNQQNHTHRLRKDLIHFTSHLLDHRTPNVLTIIITILESLQIIATILIKPLQFKSIFLHQLRPFIAFLYPDHLIRNTSIEKVFIPLLFVIALLHIAFFIRAFYKFTKAQKSRLEIIAHYSFIFCSVLTAPGFLFSFTTFVCPVQNSFQPSQQCYKGYHIVQMLMALMIIVWLIGANLFKTAFYINKNPFDFSYFSGSSNLWMLGGLAIKLAPSVFLVVDPTLYYDVLYVVSLAALNIGYLVFFRFFQPFYRNNQFFDRICLRCETMTSIVIIFFIPLYFMSKNYPLNCMFIVSWLIGGIVSEFIVMYFGQRKDTLRNKILNGKYNKEDAQGYIEFFYGIIHKIETKKQSQSDFFPHLLLDLAMSHRIRCSVLGCNCHHIVQKSLMSAEGLTDVEIYKLILFLVRQIQASLPKLLGLIFLEAYIEYFKLGCQTRSILLFYRLQSPKNQWNQEIQIERMFFNLKEEKKEFTDLIKYKDFSENLWKFQEMVQSTAKKCEQYWTELIQQQCEISKIWRKSQQIIGLKKEVQDFSKERLLKIFPSNLYVKRIYLQISLFIFRVEVAQVKQQILQFQKTLTEESEPNEIAKKMVFRENCDMTVFCTYKEDSDYKFCNVSSNVENLLKLQNTYLSGKSINQIIPKYLQQFHHDKVSDYFSREDQNIQPRQDIIYVPRKDNVIICCSYFTKILPSLVYGVELVGFMKKNEEKSPCLYAMYYYKTVCTMNNNKANSHMSSGIIAEMDIGLKTMFCIDEEDTHISIEQLIPQWCIYSECYYMDGESDQTQLISSIERVDSIRVKQTIDLRTIKISLTHNSEQPQFSFLSENPSLTQWKKASNKNLMLKDVSKNEFSQMLRHTQAEELTAMPLITQVIQNQQSRTSNNFQSISTNLLLLLLLLLLCAFIICAILNYTISKQNVQKFDQNIQIVEISSESAEFIARTAISLHKIQSLEIVVNDVEAEIESELKLLVEITDKIYEKIGFETLNKEIKPILKVIGQNGSMWAQQTTLREGISHFEAESKNYLQTLAPQYSLFVQQNWLMLFDQSPHIVSISKQLYNQVSSHNNMVLSVLNGVQLFIVSAIAMSLIIRIKMTFQFIRSTVEYYEKEISIENIKGYERECSSFIQRVKGKSIQEQISEQGMIGVLGELDKIISPFQKQNKSHFNDDNLPIKEEELQNLKNKVTFQELPSRKSLMLVVIITCACFVGIKLGLIYLMDIRFENQSYQDFTKLIEQGHIIERMLTKLLYFKEVQNEQLFKQVVVEIQKTALNLSLNNFLPDKFTFQDLLRTLSTLHYQQFSSIMYEQLQESVLRFQTKIHQYMHHISMGNGEQFPLLMELAITIAILFLLIIWKYVVFEVESMIEGCTKMKQIVGNPQNRLTHSTLMVSNE